MFASCAARGLGPATTASQTGAALRNPFMPSSSVGLLPGHPGPGSVDPHRAERNALDVTQARAGPKIEHLAHADVGAKPQGEVRLGGAAAGRDEKRRLSVGNDTHLGVLGID